MTGVENQPWLGEPDRLDWTDAATALPCLILRGNLGALCGYVAVPPGHPLHGREYSDEGLADIHVHGGLTYSGACFGQICHTPAAGEPDNVWWFGFDCAHYEDFVPAYTEHDLHIGGTYRTISYVREECRRLALQLAGRADRPGNDPSDFEDDDPPPEEDEPARLTPSQKAWGDMWEHWADDISRQLGED